MRATVCAQEEIWAEWSEEGTCRAAPLLALLPASLADARLARRAAALLRCVIERVRARYAARGLAYYYTLWACLALRYIL